MHHAADTMSDEATLPVARVVPAATAAAAAAAPAFVFGSTPPAAVGSAAAEEEEVLVGLADLLGLYGSVEVRIENIANKLQAAVDVQDFQGAAQLKEALETCRAHLDQTHVAIVVEAQRAQDEAKRARDEARQARLAARGGNPLRRRSEADASSRSKFVRSCATVRVGAEASCRTVRAPVVILVNPSSFMYQLHVPPPKPKPGAPFPGGDGRRNGRAMGGAARAGDLGRRHRHSHCRGPRLALGLAEREGQSWGHGRTEARSRSGHHRA